MLPALARSTATPPPWDKAAFPQSSHCHWAFTAQEHSDFFFNKVMSVVVYWAELLDTKSVQTQVIGTNIFRSR